MRRGAGAPRPSEVVMHLQHLKTLIGTTVEEKHTVLNLFKMAQMTLSEMEAGASDEQVKYMGEDLEDTLDWITRLTVPLAGKEVEEKVTRRMIYKTARRAVEGMRVVPLMPTDEEFDEDY